MDTGHTYSFSTACARGKNHVWGYSSFRFQTCSTCENERLSTHLSWIINCAYFLLGRSHLSNLAYFQSLCSDFATIGYINMCQPLRNARPPAREVVRRIASTNLAPEEWCDGWFGARHYQSRWSAGYRAIWCRLADLLTIRKTTDSALKLVCRIQGYLTGNQKICLNLSNTYAKSLFPYCLWGFRRRRRLKLGIIVVSNDCACEWNSNQEDISPWPN